MASPYIVRTDHGIKRKKNRNDIPIFLVPRGRLRAFQVTVLLVCSQDKTFTKSAELKRVVSIAEMIWLFFHLSFILLKFPFSIAYIFFFLSLPFWKMEIAFLKPAGVLRL